MPSTLQMGSSATVYRQHPIDLLAAAKSLRIRVVYAHGLWGAAESELLDDGAAVIRVAYGLSRAERRHAIAHEIAEVQLARQDSSAIEAACDALADAIVGEHDSCTRLVAAPKLGRGSRIAY